MSETTDKTQGGQRRKLTPEEREAMKRELKAQMRAYVDALKEQMLGAKEKGEKPDLEEALSRAEQEAARKLAQQAAEQGDPMVEKAARVQAAARTQAPQQDASKPAPKPKHDGMIPKLSAWQPAEAGSDDADDAGRNKDVLNVASDAAQAQPAEQAPEEKPEPQAAASAGFDVHPDSANVSSAGQGGEGTGSTDGYIVPEEEAAKSAIPRDELERMTKDIIAQLKTIYDPEIPVDIYELGLIYRIDIADDRTVTIDMTLTAPGCPVAGDMPGWVQEAVRKVEGVEHVKVNLVFDPPWDMSRMSDEARLALNMF